ncbi:MAG: serine--tRNA ligase [Brevinematales bacterium]|jgi:seryl-tRNA synthetase
MLDIRLITEDSAKVKERLKYRRVQSDLIDTIISLNTEKRETQKSADELRNMKKTLSKDVGMLKSKGEDASGIMAKVAGINTRLESLEEKEKSVNSGLESAMLIVPNLPLEDVPEGADDTSNVEIKKWGTPRKFDFKPLPHFELGQKLGILDFERGARISGSGFTLYHGGAAKLERALINFMLDTHAQAGYEEKLVPFLINSASLQGTGQLPKFKDDLYRIDSSDLYLNPTAEVPLTNIYRGEVLRESDLPLKITAYAPSFRLEAGSWGSQTRGLIRQHQFNKVELVKFTKPEDSAAEHEDMLSEAEKILKLLELPYRVVLLSSGDMGFSAAKCYDLEVWLPGQSGAEGGYREISSVSNCMDFQSRRASIKFKRDSTGKQEFVHTLNGSGLAVGRTLVAVMENYQQEDGSILIPLVLQKYMDGLKAITAAKQ